MNRRRKSDHTLGKILVDMGIVSAQQLSDVVKMQQQLSREQLLGRLLIGEGIISESQLRAALNAQGGLRSRSRCDRALAVAAVAQESGATVVRLATRIRTQRTSEMRKRLPTSPLAVK